MVTELEVLRQKMFKVPKADAKNIILSLILDPLKQSMENLQRIIE